MEEVCDICSICVSCGNIRINLLCVCLEKDLAKVDQVSFSITY